jgi:hypothetical protein
MLEELWEVLASKWGLLGLGAVLVFSGPGRKYVRGAAKKAIKAGLCVSDAAREFAAEVKEQGSDLIAEVKAERKESAEQPVQHTEKKDKRAAE